MKQLCIVALMIGLLAGMVACKSNPKKDQTPTRGEATVLVDETIYPLVDAEVYVFESQYPYADITIEKQPENRIAQLLLDDTSRIAILTRDLNEQEKAYFESKSIIPVTTELGYDAIALIVNKNSADTVISEAVLKRMLLGQEPQAKAMLVFDNPASSTVQYFKRYAGVDTFPQQGVYSLNTNEEVIQYIADHDHAIGFVGINWLYEADSTMQPWVDKIKLLAVSTEHGAVKPTQDEVAGGLYPFVRAFKPINCQGAAGLGVGLASFIASDPGQRIILKAGLVPASFPKREIKIRK